MLYLNEYIQYSLMNEVMKLNPSNVQSLPVVFTENLHEDMKIILVPSAMYFVYDQVAISVNVITARLFTCASTLYMYCI